MGTTRKRSKLKNRQSRVVIEQRRPFRPLAASLLEHVDLQRRAHNKEPAEALHERYRPEDKP